MQSHNTEDEDQRQHQHHDGVDLETGGLVRVQPYRLVSTSHPVGVISQYALSIVELLPPAPAARVLVGRAFAIFSFWSAAARRRIAVRAPPGAAGEEGRPMDAPVAAAPPSTGDWGRGED